jgi:hypothetical protein
LGRFKRVTPKFPEVSWQDAAGSVCRLYNINIPDGIAKGVFGEKSIDGAAL